MSVEVLQNLSAKYYRPQMSVEKLAGGGDLRAATLLESLQEVMHGRGKGMPVPTIIGVLEILKFDLMKKVLNDRAIQTIQRHRRRNIYGTVL